MSEKPDATRKVSAPTERPRSSVMTKSEVSMLRPAAARKPVSTASVMISSRFLRRNVFMAFPQAAPR
jgi:hypothetical protein